MEIYGKVLGTQASRVVKITVGTYLVLRITSPRALTAVEASQYDMCHGAYIGGRGKGASV